MSFWQLHVQFQLDVVGLGGIDALGLVPVVAHDFSGGARGFHGGGEGRFGGNSFHQIILRNDFVARLELLQLRGAFFLEQFFLGGLDGVQSDRRLRAGAAR